MPCGGAPFQNDPDLGPGMTRHCVLSRAKNEIILPDDYVSFRRRLDSR